MSQEDLNCSGIYFLASRFLDGSYIYKVGKSENIAKRIKQYPQNFELKLHIECLNRHVSEREVIQVVDRLEDSGIVKCGQGNEFFRSETDKIKEIEYAIYKWYFVTERTRTREITREENREEDKRRLDVGTKAWYENDVFRRIVSPAIERADGANKLEPKRAYNLHMKDEIARLKISHPYLDHKARFKMASGNWLTSSQNPKYQG